jgi:hypothetical protein
MRTNQELADFHGVDARTIRRWRAAGACLDDDEAMQLWKAVYGRTRRHSMDRGELRAPADPTEAEIDEWWETVAKPIWERHKAERSQSRTA